MLVIKYKQFFLLQCLISSLALPSINLTKPVRIHLGSLKIESITLI